MRSRYGYQWTTTLLGKVVLVAAISLTQIGCATARHPAFTADRVLNIRIGQTANEIKEIYGPPDRIPATTCGSSTDSPWQCLIWEYDLGPHPKGRYKNLNNTNRFMFNAETDPPLLNSWTIDLMYEAPRK